MNKVSVQKVIFKGFKGLKNYSINLNEVNICVGPNNAGKSTLISSFRILDVCIRVANSKKASYVYGPSGKQVLGYEIKEDAIPIPLLNVHTDYQEIDTTILFILSNKNRLLIFFPKVGGIIFIPECDNTYIKGPKEFRKEFPFELRVVPVLGPLEQEEKIVSPETVRKNLNTTRASRHFRNYWMYYPEEFESFSDMISATWSGMNIRPPEKPNQLENDLVMFCEENRIPRELYWVGFGFQIWCQLLTYISRCKNSDLLVIDEPEVYLHPDVQRQLLSLLRECGPDILIATHSIEIIGEADPNEILLIDKNKSSAERLRNIEGIQKAIDSIGSIQNITLAHMARTGKILFAEGEKDYKLLVKFAQKLGLNTISSENRITFLSSGGFSAWTKIKDFAWGFKNTINSTVRLAAIFDRDYRCTEEINDIVHTLEEDLYLAHIHNRKELENYLIEPVVMDRALVTAIRSKEKRTGETIKISKTCMDLLVEISAEIKFEVQAQYLDKRRSYLIKTGKDGAVLNKETLTEFEKKWTDINQRVTILPGKEVLKKIREQVQLLYKVSLSDSALINAYTKNEIPEDIKEFLVQLEDFAIQ